MTFVPLSTVRGHDVKMSVITRLMWRFRACLDADALRYDPARDQMFLSRNSLIMRLTARLNAAL